MSWLFSQALAAEYLAARRLDGGQYAPSSTSNTRPKYYYTDKIPENWKHSRYGMTCAPLTADRGAELLTWYREVSLVKIFPQQGKVPASLESDPDCGVKWRELSERYDLDMHGWKTARSLFPEDLPWSSVTLPKWGTLVGGVLSERTTPAHLTSGTGVGYWRTPECNKGGTVSESVLQRMADGEMKRDSGHTRQLSLRDQVRHEKLWPTCDVRGFTNDGSLIMLKNKCKSRSEWSQMGYRAAIGKKEKLWPTATVKGIDGGSHSRAAAKSRGMWPTVYSVTYPTPTKSDGTGGPGNSPGRGGDNLRTVVQGSLNPDWVEWLMGWPIGWTDIDRINPDFSIDWQQDPADIGEVPRVCTGMKHRAARIKAIGNGQCPQAMVLAYETLSEDW